MNKTIKFDPAYRPRYVDKALKGKGCFFNQELDMLNDTEMARILNIPTNLYRHAVVYSFYDLGVQPAGFNRLVAPDDVLCDTARKAFRFKNSIEAATIGHKIVAIVGITADQMGDETYDINGILFEPTVAPLASDGRGMVNIITYQKTTQGLSSHPCGWTEAYRCPRTVAPEERIQVAEAQMMKRFFSRFTGEKLQAYMNLLSNPKIYGFRQR